MFSFIHKLLILRSIVPPDYYSFYNNQHYRVYQQHPTNPSQLQQRPPVPQIPIGGFCRLNEQHPMMFNQQDIVDEVNITSCNKAIKLICNILDRSLASLPRTRLPLSIVGSIAYVSNTTLSPTTNPSTVFFGWRLL